jgi:hypothetical protein
MLLLYTMGYNMIESAQRTQVYLYWQNIYLGDPLTSPWAERPLVSLSQTEEVPINQALVISAEHTDGIAEIRLYVDGARVATGSGDELHHTLDGTQGDSLEILAIAISEDAVVSRPGWPTSETLARPEIQGWSTARIVLGPPAAEEDTGAPKDTGSAQDIHKPGEPDASGCGCSTSTQNTAWALLPLILIGWRRRA